MRCRRRASRLAAEKKYHAAYVRISENDTIHQLHSYIPGSTQADANRDGGDSTQPNSRALFHDAPPTAATLCL